MRLALFDLDHTLIDFDSGITWLRHGMAAGLLAAGAEQDYLAEARRYTSGTLDIHALHRACVGVLRDLAPAQLALWQAGFAKAIAPRIAQPMRALVQAHHDAGDCCVIVTATARLVAEPFARLFGVRHLIATESRLQANGMPGGEVEGLPSFREYKVARVEAWLAPQTLAGVERSWFYSDSINDLALLAAVTDPVAVRPDAALRAHAQAAGWRVIDD